MNDRQYITFDRRVRGALTTQNCVVFHVIDSNVAQSTVVRLGVKGGGLMGMRWGGDGNDSDGVATTNDNWN